MEKLLGLVIGFAGQIDAQIAEDIVVYLRKQYRRMGFAASQPAQLLEGQLRRRVGSGADRQRHQHLVSVQPGVFVAQIAGFQPLNWLDEIGRN